MDAPFDEKYDFDAYITNEQLWDRELDCFGNDVRRYAKAHGLGLRRLRAIFDAGVFTITQSQQVRRCVDDFGEARMCDD